jgi:hypothetical protein
MPSLLASLYTKGEAPRLHLEQICLRKRIFLQEAQLSMQSNGEVSIKRADLKTAPDTVNAVLS